MKKDKHNGQQKKDEKTSPLNTTMYIEKTKFKQFKYHHDQCDQKLEMKSDALEWEKVWGIAYEIANEQIDYVTAHLDFREKNGYTQTEVVFYPSEEMESPIHLKIYIGTSDNEEYLGPAPIEDIAKQIYDSVGPSGKNIDYLLNLANAVRQLFPEETDEHLFELEKSVKHKLNESIRQ